MLYYYILLLFLMAMSFCASQMKSIKALALLFSLAGIFVFFAFRIGFTPDYYNYENYFTGNEIIKVRHIGREPLFLFLVNTLPSYRWILVLQTLLYCTVLYVLLKYYINEKYWWLAFVLLFFISGGIRGNMSALRSCFVTIAFTMGFLIKDKSTIGKLIAIALVSASALIHNSGWVILPFLFVSNKPMSEKSKKTFMTISVILILLSLFASRVLGNGIELLTQVLGIQETAEFYYKGKINNTFYLGAGTIFRISMILVLFFISFGNINNMNLSDIERLCVKYMAIFFLINLMPSVAVIERYYYYFIFPCLVGTAAVLKYEKKQIYRMLFMVLFILYGFWDIYFMRFASFYNNTWGIYHNVLLGI